MGYMALKSQHWMLNLFICTTLVFLTISYILVSKTYSLKTTFASRGGVSGNDTEAKQVRVLIWVMTSPQNLNTKAKAVKETWAKRCKNIIFFSSENNTDFPAVGLQVPEGRQHLTGKTMKGFQYVYEHHFGDADWFMKVDDDTYVILENLLYFLSTKNADEPVYFGQHFNVLVKQGYYSGGAGYILSKEALRRFGKRSPNNTACPADGGAEDVKMGSCMESLGVPTEVSKDSAGRSLFHCFRPETHVFGGFPAWFRSYVKEIRQGQDSISEYAISFHYISPEAMVMLDFYLYHLKKNGVPLGENNGGRKHQVYSKLRVIQRNQGNISDLGTEA